MGHHSSSTTILRIATDKKINYLPKLFFRFYFSNKKYFKSSDIMKQMKQLHLKKLENKIKVFFRFCDINKFNKQILIGLECQRFLLKDFLVQF